MKKERENMGKSMKGMSKVNKEKTLDRPMIIDSPGINKLFITNKE